MVWMTSFFCNKIDKESMNLFFKYQRIIRQFTFESGGKI
ncbi:hypothetical protein M948_04380 [Virgibacillus sp. CM-4]|nr:hypothetical protein M948_04380 [Virgibacillus sp. CM-4]